MSRISAFILIVGMCLTGCHATYPKDYVEESIKEICREEYGITEMEIKISGKTLGVYLPLQQLFSVDYEKFLSGQAVGDLESLMQFHPEALETVEDVLFTTSRVILSTDREVDFYLLNATDTQVTGIQFVIVGYVDDMKRVRFWDISRSEYRKRLIHDLSINKAILWKRPVVELFESLPEKTMDELQQEFLIPGATLDSLSPHFFAQLSEAYRKQGLQYTVLDVRAKPLENNQVLVYASVQETFTDDDTPFSFKKDAVYEYLFILKMQGMDFKIVKTVPFYMVLDDGSVHDVEFPPDLEIYKNIEEWPSDFEFDEVLLPDFIAEQVTKRIEALLSFDQKVQDAFTERKGTSAINCSYEPVTNLEETTIIQENRFRFYISMRLRDKLFLTADDFQKNADVHYLLSMMLTEIGQVIQAYRFSEYAAVEIRVPLMKESMIIDRRLFEQFLKGKVSISELVERCVFEEVF